MYDMRQSKETNDQPQTTKRNKTSKKGNKKSQAVSAAGKPETQKTIGPASTKTTKAKKVKKKKSNNNKISNIDKLELDNVECASLVMVCRTVLRILALSTSLCFVLLISESVYMDYYQQNNPLWVLPLFFMVNELSQYFQHIDYTILVKHYCYYHYDENQPKGKKISNECRLNKKDMIVNISTNENKAFHNIILIENIVHLSVLLVFGSLMTIVFENEDHEQNENQTAMTLAYLYPSLCLACGCVFCLSFL